MKRKCYSLICVFVALLACTVMGYLHRNDEIIVYDIPITTVDTSEAKLVYKTPTGKRYHYSDTCGGGNSTAVDLGAAISFGLTPCKKCVH